MTQRDGRLEPASLRPAQHHHRLHRDFDARLEDLRLDERIALLHGLGLTNDAMLAPTAVAACRHHRDQCRLLSHLRRADRAPSDAGGTTHLANSGRQVDLQHRIGQRGEPGRCPPLAFRPDLAANAGTAGSLTVIAKDAYGNIAPGYRGKVHLTSTDTAATLPPDYTFTAADAGVHSFSVTLKTVERSP